MSPTTSNPTGPRNVITALGAKLSRTLSRDGSQSQSQSQTSTLTAASELFFGAKAPTMSDSPHSPPRGRDLTSYGRGGAGNIHRSQSRDAATSPPPPRGREQTPSREPITHVGRGGVGNYHPPAQSPDHGVTSEQAAYEHHLVEQHEDSPHFFSTGRGGAGNIKPSTPEHSASRSRSRGPESPVVERSLSRGRVLHSTGRGGVGNITSDPVQEEEADELERRAYSPSRTHQDDPHSTGRGGLANVTSLSSPPIEAARSPSRDPHDGDGDERAKSIGRGGAGNIRERTRSASRGRGSGGVIDARPDADAHHGPLGKLLDRVKGRHPHHHEAEHGHEEFEKQSYSDGHGVETVAPPNALK